MAQVFTEINIDGMIGPTHHFGGLGVGNIASQASQYRTSNPRAAALEGLAKMQLLVRLGVTQFFLPPLSRPNWTWLEPLGYTGHRGDSLKRCFDRTPELLSAAYSSSFMWTANAATVAPSCDASDFKLHIVPANLCCNLHRGQEAIDRRNQLRELFSGDSDVMVHEPIPSVFPLRDEGAANHIRLCAPDRIHAIHLFVFGPSIECSGKRFVGRQSELASRQVAMALQLPESDLVFAQQSVQAIEAGVFHNDVISMSNEDLLIFHEHAFDNCDAVVETIGSQFTKKTGERLRTLQITNRELSIEQAVQTYLFNSQLISTDTGSMELICPEQCNQTASTKRLIEGWINDDSNPIARVHFVKLHESMANGGGPACLRLRVMLNQSQLQSINTEFRADDARIEQLTDLVEQWYPDNVTLSDLSRLDFAEHVSRAIELMFP